MDPRSALASFAGACRARGLAVTHQRLAIYEALLLSRSHPGAEEVYREARAKAPTVSRGTVYRTLETLSAMGLVTDVASPGGGARFEARLEPHHHLICLSCRRIVDVDRAALGEPPASWRRRAPRGLSRGEAEGFEVTGFQIQFHGFCGQCRRKRRNTNQRRS